MIVVACLYNKNGMGTWCLETAQALHAGGMEVVLVKTTGLELPQQFPFPVVECNLQAGSGNRSLQTKITDKLNSYWKLLPFTGVQNNQLEALHKQLLAKGITPRAYLLNQTSFVSPAVKVPQYVVAWAYQPFLKNYLKKALVLARGWRSFKSGLQNALFWHKTDWWAYRNATGVMAVSVKLADALKQQGINAGAVYPGVTHQTPATEPLPQKGKIRMAMMALDLDDERKGFSKMITLLKKMDKSRFELTLIGNAPTNFHQRVLEENFPARFTGLLSRQEAFGVLQLQDVLLFGSLVDDWGFVQIEAMMQGTAILSPHASPFDEIIGREDYLYEPGNDAALEEKLNQLLQKQHLEEDRIWFRNRYQQLFSGTAFTHRIKEFTGL